MIEKKVRDVEIGDMVATGAGTYRKIVEIERPGVMFLIRFEDDSGTQHVGRYGGDEMFNLEEGSERKERS